MPTPLLPSGLEQIRAALEHAVKGIETELVAQLTKAYRAQSDRSFAALLEVARDPKHTGYMPRPFSGYSQWAKLNKELAEKKVKGKDGVRAILRGSADTFEELREIADFLVPTYSHADKEARESFENARDSFVAKNLRKFREVLGKRTDVEDVQIKFGFLRGVFEGAVTVKLSDSTLTGHVSLKYVVRYTPRVTPYYQYPLLFSAVVKGRTFRSLSEEELRIMLGGGTSEQYEAEQAAQAAAEGWCPGAGKMVPPEIWRGIYNMYVKTAQCPDCGASVGVPTGKFRKHKTVASGKAVAESKLKDSGHCPMSNKSAPYPLIAKFIRPITVYPSGVPTIQHSFDIFDDAGKYRKILCEACGQNIAIGDDRSSTSGPEGVKAFYRKHKVSK